MGMNDMADGPPFRAEHVGSFPRPEPLMKARDEFAAGRIELAALRKVEDAAVAEVVAMQERVGVGAITDGEFRRASWRDAPFEHFAGFTEERYEADFTFRLFDGTTRKAGPVPSVVAKLTRASPMTADTFALLKPMTKGLPKANLPTPSITHFFRGRAQIDKAVYPHLNDYFADVTRLYRDEVADLAAAGCKYLQMDEVPLALLCDPNIKAIVKRRGEDPDRIVDLYIGAINDSIRGRPKDMAVAVHMCRGNQGHGMSDTGYGPLADKLFNLLEVDGFFLEYDTPRAGDFAALRYLPKGKKAALGLVSTKLPEVETADALEGRIAEAAKCAPVDQLCLCPQCGFSSNANTGRLTLSVVEAKLARIVEVAHKVWG
jgi:methionine synthase II (cobalamin-independent)